MILSRLESEVLRIIELSECIIVKNPSDKPTAFDFGIEYRSKKIAIEVKGEATPSTFFGILGYQLPEAAQAGYSELWLVSPSVPSSIPAADPANQIVAKWLSLEQFAEEIGVQRAQLDSLTPFSEKNVRLLDVLASQFPKDRLTDIKTDEQLESFLKLGERQDGVTAVFADIKSFTEIVHNSEPSLLNEMLGQYYRIARGLTHLFEGTFDKVIGDAVLSVFNYPSSVDAVSNALRYAITLIQAAEGILAELMNKSTRVIETGIRVGIATGSVWPIDVGDKVPQVSFVGDPLNLAARLQHKAETNGIAICRESWILAVTQDKGLTDPLKPEEARIGKGKLSGVESAINLQLISRKNMPAQF